jgi:hypothetical protein
MSDFSAALLAFFFSFSSSSIFFFSMLSFIVYRIRNAERRIRKEERPKNKTQKTKQTIHFRHANRYKTNKQTNQFYEHHAIPTPTPTPYLKLTHESRHLSKESLWFDLGRILAVHRGDVLPVALHIFPDHHSLCELTAVAINQAVDVLFCEIEGMQKKRN